MRILLALAFLLAFLAPAHAQDTITVINEDGTKTSIDIGPSPLGSSAPPPVELRIEPKAKSAAPALSVAVDPAPVAKPAKKAAAPEKKKAPVKKETASKKKKAQPEKKAKQKPAPKSKKKQAAPAAPVPAPATTLKRPPATSAPQRLGEQMTPDDAIRIALDAAPPARSVNAHPVNYKGLHAYQVVFATEDGNRSVFVDRETGKIVK